MGGRGEGEAGRNNTSDKGDTQHGEVGAIMPRTWVYARL